MKKILYLLSLIILISPLSVKAEDSLVKLNGSILLQVESQGEAWYLSPNDNNLHFLGRPDDAFTIMKKLALGVTHELIANTTIFPDRLLGQILLDVEQNGEAYYIYPVDRHKYFLGRPDDAFKIMKNLSLGISNNDLLKLKTKLLANEEILINDIPFTSQAPFANWNDDRQQNACEESSAIMAMSWVNNKNLSKEDSLDKIIKLSKYLENKYGTYVDSSTQDTMDWIFKDYFKYAQVERFANVDKDKIIEELRQERLVLAAFDGRKLNNPNFTSPGPTTHMLVILGYNSNSDEFITNDPGTRNGKNYHYNTDILFQAIRDYPSGDHEEIKSIEKNIIVIEK